MSSGPSDSLHAVAPKRRAAAVYARFAHPASPAWNHALALLPVALPTLALAFWTVDGVNEKLGHPGATLDDSFIHFQYARAIAEGHPFRYAPGEPMTMGATSALWPLLLAPFYLLGCKGLLLMWPAWGLSFAALGLLAREVWLLTRPLAGEHAAVGAGALVLAFSPFTWCAGSGMEVVPFALCLVRAVRRSSESVEHGSTARGRYELVALAFIAPLLRPEGALASLVVAVALAATGGTTKARRLGLTLLALAGAVMPQLLSLVVTGSLRSNTAQVKLLYGNPYYVGPAFWAAVRENLRTLLHVLLNGEIWSAEFIPHGAATVAFAGLVAIAWRARPRSLWFRATAILVLALAIAVPCFYVTFLWNRLRYLWPFASFWLVGVACLARVVGDALARARPRWQLVTPILVGLGAGLFAAKLEGTMDDVASSASGIDRQQVALGRWADQALPKDARIGVNDTGAIAYFGNRPTFDIVGLTTPGEGRYWVAGAASRFEHYERLYASQPAALPTHFIVYPEWMAMNEVLGRRLHDATVTDSTILGGQTMVAYEADYARLGTGEQPWTPTSEAFTDVLDVADLESEGAHGYALLGALDGEEVLTLAATPAGNEIADGGRRSRARERFQADLGHGASRGIVRLETSEETRVHVLVGGAEKQAFVAHPGSWTEATFTLPDARGRSLVELVPDNGTLTTYHYWFAPSQPSMGTP